MSLGRIKVRWTNGPQCGEVVVSDTGAEPLQTLRTLHPKKGEAGFRWRGGDPTRVEALSDMVFAFALTLLVVSVEPPSTYAELIDQLWGFPGFAAAFALLLVIWHGHYVFFRRYGLSDGVTTLLNAGLLFLILFFVYPLKFHATMLSAFLRSIVEGTVRAPMSAQEARAALMLICIGYAAVFAMFGLLYGQAIRRSDRLELTPEERLVTRMALREQMAHVVVALFALAAAWLIPMPWSPFSGFIFFLVGPAIMAANASARRDLVRRGAEGENADEQAPQHTEAQQT